MASVTVQNVKLHVQFKGNEGEDVVFVLAVGNCRTVTTEQQDDLVALCKEIYETNHGPIIDEGLSSAMNGGQAQEPRQAEEPEPAPATKAQASKPVARRPGSRPAPKRS